MIFFSLADNTIHLANAENIASQYNTMASVSIDEDEDWEDEFIKRGFKTYFSNFHGTQFTNFYKRYNKGISGISISNWSLLNCDHMQRNRVFFAAW